MASDERATKSPGRKRTKTSPKKGARAAKRAGSKAKDLSREVFERREEETRTSLLTAQLSLVDEKKKAVLVVVAGLSGSGRGETVNLLGEWMDPRHVRTHAFGDPIEEEKELPFSYRFVRDLPKRGQVGIFFAGWYQGVVERAVAGKKTDPREILGLEATLADNGVHLVKLFFDLDRKAQKKRFLELEGDKDTRWRVTKDDWRDNANHEKIHAASLAIVRATSTPKAPWQIVDGARPRAAAIEVGRALSAAITASLADKAEKKGKIVLPAPLPKARYTKTPTIDEIVYRTLDDAEYDERLERAQKRIALVARHKRFSRHGAAIVFEGADAAGKGGAIRRLTRALDARLFEVVPIAAPSEEERAHPYLWRFYRKLPRHGRFSIFDRSWYGRLLVERIEGFATPQEVARAYGEIVRFEDEIRARGTAVIKLWLAIDKDEQKRRFQKRQSLEFKRYKITEEDFRNREKWDAYVEAANDLFERTSTKEAPWKVVGANDKKLARVTVLEHVAERLEELVR